MARRKKPDHAQRARDLADQLNGLIDELAEMVTDDEAIDAFLDKAITGLTTAEEALDEYADLFSSPLKPLPHEEP